SARRASVRAAVGPGAPSIGGPVSGCGDGASAALAGACGDGEEGANGRALARSLARARPRVPARHEVRLSGCAPGSRDIQQEGRMTLSPKQRAACEDAGVDEVRAKMAYAGPGDGAVVPGLGDGLITRKDAACWIKEQGQQREIIALKPGLWGFSI